MPITGLKANTSSAFVVEDKRISWMITTLLNLPITGALYVSAIFVCAVTYSHAFEFTLSEEEFDFANPIHRL